MRARALLGGTVIVAAVALWHRPSTDHGSSGDYGRTTCERAGAGDFCTAITALSKSLHSSMLPIARVARAGVLPPPETPGATNPDVTENNVGRTICQPGYARSVRPSESVMGPLKHRLMDAQHPGEPTADYELDHLIPISIGGAPLDMRNLWLQHRRGQANAGDKNVLAYVLRRLVCEHRVPLETAQHEISRDWTKAYSIYATPDNLAKYPFPRDEEERD